jgi:hypothetical protein
MVSDKSRGQHHQGGNKLAIKPSLSHFVWIFILKFVFKESSRDGYLLIYAEPPFISSIDATCKAGTMAPALPRPFYIPEK